jgi:predicted PurR-regulated permease PerM
MPPAGTSTTQKLIGPLLVVVLVLLILRLTPLPLRHIFLVVTTAVLIAAAVSPVASALHRRAHIPLGVSVLLLYATGFLLLAAVVAVAVPLIADEVQLLRQRLPEYDAQLRDFLARLGVDQPEHYAGSALVERAGEELSHSLGRATGFAVSFSGGVVRVVIVIVLGYFLATAPHLAEDTIRRFVPPEHRGRILRLCGRIGVRLGQWARAQILLAIVFGVSFGIGLRLVGVPYAATLGATGAVLEVVPYVGGAVTLVLALLVAATVSPWAMLGVIAVYTVAVLFESHVLAPYLMGRAVGFQPLVVLLALFVGVEAMGVFGALLAVPIAVVIQAILDEFYTFAPEPISTAGDGDHSTPP